MAGAVAGPGQRHVDASTGSMHPPVPPLLTSRRHPLVRQLRRLHGSRGRREAGVALLEGSHLLEEALALGRLPSLVVHTEHWAMRHSRQLAQLVGRCPCQPVSAAVLEVMATTVSPDGVLCTLPLEAGPPWPSAPGFLLALDRIQDPGNLGTLLRTALAAGVEGVHQGAGADPLQPKVMRSSAGAGLHLPLRRHGDLLPVLHAAQAGGMQCVAAVVHGDRSYWELDWTIPTLLLLGNEGCGIAPGLSAACDRHVTVPHRPTVESLNVAVAGALLLFERLRQSR